MIKVYEGGKRGKTKIDWLNSWHSFSFGEYYDPNNMGFKTLRVINEDIVKPSAGFSPHPHRDMEIITYVLEGALQHQDSLGNGSTIVPGDVQHMTAGSGIVHSEFNPLPDKPVHLLQIWIMPDKKGLPPGYQQENFTQKRKAGKLTPLATFDGREDSLIINQDANLSVLDLDAGQSFELKLPEKRSAWVQLARGNVKLGDTVLKQGDGVAVTDEKVLKFSGQDKAEVLIFDLAA